MTDSPLLVPLQIEAFRLNEAVCGTGEVDDHSARIAPITQPNYTFLRLDNFVIQNDVLAHTDLHNAAPAAFNPRMRDLGKLPTTKHRHRQGIYLHWTLPRFYRSGVAMADSATEARRKDEREKRGLPTDNAEAQKVGSSTPGFLQPPTHWLVIRKLDLDSVSPPEAKASFKEYAAWVIESDYQWKLDEIPLDYDLQVDVSPFIMSTGDTVNIKQQAEVFIGRKTPLEHWTEDPKLSHPDISLIRSSNQLFADYQPHNSNVFSMLDNFRYGDPGTPQYLSQATASYYLLGWHWSNDVDPLWDSTNTVDHQTRISGLFMGFPGEAISQDEQKWLDAKDSVRLLCHGAMYDVVWNDSQKPGNVPADDFARHLRDPTVPAMSVGTTPIDALITYCTARKGKGDDSSSIQQLEEDILAIESLLHARDDGVEGQREAKDTVYDWNFARSSGGQHYFLGGEDQNGKPTDPDCASKDAVTDINKLQLLYDACVRVLQQYRWDMFSLWWKYVSDARNSRTDDKANEKSRDDTDTLSKRISNLESLIEALHDQIEKKVHPDASTPAIPVVPGTPIIPVQSTIPAVCDSPQVPDNPLKNAKTGTLPFFYRGQDPTVLVGGIDSGWALDYLDNVKVRLPTQTVGSTTVPEGLTNLVNMMTTPTHQLPSVFSRSIKALTTEFWALRPDGGQAGPAAEGTYYPQFHDQNTADTPQVPSLLTGNTAPIPSSDPRWRDRWSDRQPWFPLFAEWEVEYTHIPYDYWTLDEQAARLSDNKLVRYGIDVPSGEALYDKLAGQLDQYILSGRVLILPQPSFSLQAKVKQLFSDTPPQILEPYLKESERENLLTHLNALSFLSAPLSGLTDGLLTLAQGTHIKPENKVLTDTGKAELTPIAAAEFGDAGLTLDNIQKIQSNSARTPYAAVTRFDDTKNCPFKPVTHGQFRFRKFNIIDKFGQVLVANDPRPTAHGPTPVFPAISDWYEPQMYNNVTANTVLKDEDGKCEFMQLPPQINQNVRLNANFVLDTALNPVTPNYTESAKWRPASEWEIPIWGWIVVNYADYGIQLFLPDGTFYREVRIGGPTGSLAGPKWTPFAPDSSHVGTKTAQLDALITKLGDADYLTGFWWMITNALDALPPAPSTYAGFLNSIVGKPLALVNVGWSLELDGPAYTNQSTNSAVTNPNRALLPRSQSNPFDPNDSSYDFRIKLGDHEREYDGLVGYFNMAGGSSGTELDLSSLYTYFTPAQPTKPLAAITKENYPRFKPFWIKPFVEQEDGTISELDRNAYADQRNQAMQACGHVLGTILDPFTAIHASSSILPTNALQLPSWTWQRAMDMMTAFLHAGPYHSVADVVSYDTARRLTTQNMKDVPPSTVPLPALPAGDWNWLQPYLDPDDQSDQAVPAYNAFGLDRRGDLSRPAFQKGPYTALEGFLQLRNPIMREAPASK